MFADFDIDGEQHVFLRRISFDGFGCCESDFTKMSAEDSQILIDAVASGSVQETKIETILRRYFQKNADLIWKNALVSHKLL